MKRVMQGVCVVLFALMLSVSLVSAVWWNPFTWFQKEVQLSPVCEQVERDCGEFTGNVDECRSREALGCSYNEEDNSCSGSYWTEECTDVPDEPTSPPEESISDDVVSESSLPVPFSEPTTPGLINVDFGTSTGAVLGSAVIGNNGDYWNGDSAGVLKWANGSVSPVSISSPFLGRWGFSFGVNHQMMNSYSYDGNFFTLSNVPAGTYDVYLYGHGDKADQATTFVVNGISKTTSDTSSALTSSTWQEDLQYVVYRNVSVANGTLTIGVNGYVNGMQLLRTSMSSGGGGGGPGPRIVGPGEWANVSSYIQVNTNLSLRVAYVINYSTGFTDDVVQFDVFYNSLPAGSVGGGLRSEGTANQTILGSSYLFEYRGASTLPASAMQVRLMPFSTSTCTDSDNGINFTIRGQIEVRNSSGALVGSDWDDCDEEFFCYANGTAGIVSPVCPNGCSNGACVPTTEVNKTIHLNAGNNYVTLPVQPLTDNMTVFLNGLPNGAEIYIYDSSVLGQWNMYTRRVTLGSGWVPQVPPLHVGEGFVVKVANATEWQVTGTALSQPVYVLMHPGQNLIGTPVCPSSDLGTTYLYTASNVLRELEDFCTVVSEGNLSDGTVPRSYSLSTGGTDFALQSGSAYFVNCSTAFTWTPSCEKPVDACEKLVETMKAPTDLADRYGLQFYLRKNSTYRDEWWANERTYNGTIYYSGWNANDGEQYYNIDKEVTVFDDWRFNASTIVKDIANYNACVSRKVDTSMVYICSNDLLSTMKQYKSQFNQLFWANENVLVSVFVYSGEPLSDADITKIQMQDTQDFINALKNNIYQYTGEAFNLNDHFSDLINDDATLCPSTLSPNAPYDYSCKIEPIVCPEYGYQKQVCSFYNEQTERQETKEQTIYCSPGICSGCYVPRWFGYDNGDNVCIPYGTRLAQQVQGEKDQIEEGFGGSVSEGYNVTIYDTERAHITFWNDDNDGKTVVVAFDQDVYSGQEYAIDVGSQIVRFRVESIVPVPGQKGYIEVTILENVDAYCNYNGNIQEQKGDDAECQNNYECSSNECRAGQCVNTYVETTKNAGLLVRILCRVTTLFGTEDDYQQCLLEYG